MSCHVGAQEVKRNAQRADPIKESYTKETTLSPAFGMLAAKISTADMWSPKLVSPTLAQKPPPEVDASLHVI